MPKLAGHRSASRRVAVACALGLGACGGPSATPDADGSLDTDAFPRLTLQEELRIGSLDDPDYGFSRVGMVDVDEEGRLYVAETLDRQIRVYTSSGDLLHRIGGPGEGPGEFASGITAFGVVGDTVWALDGGFGNESILLFRRTGEPISKRTIEHLTTEPDADGRCNLVSPGMRAPDGYFLGRVVASGLMVCTAEASAASSAPPPVPRVRFDDQGHVVDTAGWYAYRLGTPSPMEIIDVGRSRYLVPGPPWVEPSQTLLADGRVQVDPSPARSSERNTFRVTRLGFADDTLYSRTYTYRPVPYPERTLDEAAARQARSGRMIVLLRVGETQMLERSPADSAAAHRALRERMPYPEFQPPVQGSHVGSDGRLWLRREETEGDSVRWTILQPDGLPVGELATPRDAFRTGWSSGSTLWAVETDELDVPWLVRYRIR